MFNRLISSSDTLIPVGKLFWSTTAVTVSPCCVVVCDRSSMIVSSEVKGFPRQLMEMWENNRCSILFHLEVAGGRWFTVMDSPVSFASCCSSFFHSRLRTPLEPPPSEVMRSRVFFGYSALPTLFHHRLMDSTANEAVS